MKAICKLHRQLVLAGCEFKLCLGLAATEMNVLSIKIDVAANENTKRLLICLLPLNLVCIQCIFLE